MRTRVFFLRIFIIGSRSLTRYLGWKKAYPAFNRLLPRFSVWLSAMSLVIIQECV